MFQVKTIQKNGNKYVAWSKLNIYDKWKEYKKFMQKQ